MDAKCYIVWSYYDNIIIISNMFKRALYYKNVNDDDNMYTKVTGTYNIKEERDIKPIGKLTQAELMLELL